MEFNDPAALAAALAGATSRRDALVRLGIANPGPSNYRTLQAACVRFGLAFPAAASPDRDRMEKWCGGCATVQPIEQFALKNATTGRRQSRCRECHSGLRRDHYLSNKEKIAGQVAERKREVRLRNMQRIVAFLLEHPCIDCGEDDPLVLQFDHVRGVKVKDVLSLVHLAKWAVIEAEMRKCVVRCANCHTRRTAAQFGWLRAALAQRVGHQASNLA